MNKKEYLLIVGSLGFLILLFSGKEPQPRYELGRK